MAPLAYVRPGLGHSTAAIVLQHFGSLGAVANASEEDYAPLKKIGKKKAQRMLGFFNSQQALE